MSGAGLKNLALLASRINCVHGKHCETAHSTAAVDERAHVPVRAALGGHNTPHPPTHLPVGAAAAAGAVQQRHDCPKCGVQSGQAVSQADVGPHWRSVGKAVEVPVRRMETFLYLTMPNIHACIPMAPAEADTAAAHLKPPTASHTEA